VRDVITTCLELAGLLLLSAGAGVAVGRWGVAGGLTTAGGCLIVSSLVVQLAAPRRRRVEGDSTA
jgi:hypothetical protein